MYGHIGCFEGFRPICFACLRTFTNFCLQRRECRHGFSGCLFLRMVMLVVLLGISGDGVYGIAWHVVLIGYNMWHSFSVVRQ